MRLAVLDSGHGFGAKALFAFIRLNEVFQEVMRGSSEWSVADRELMAAYVAKTNECEF